MEFGGLDFGLESNNSVFDLDPNTKWFGSLPANIFKERPVSVSASSTTVVAQNEDGWREMKMAKMSQDEFSKATQQQQRSNSGSVFYDSQNMLSFSTPTLPYCSRSTTGYGMRGVVGGVRGPFTPSQWMELEHQALIYKYITLNAPIPSNLLIPIRKALESAAYHPNPRHTTTTAYYGWGGFHLGFSNNPDPEPGRCRRTDGKKWRCSRDAVPDQKYCERHMNRGRHRSRKPVEGQTGHSVSNGPTTTTVAAPKVSPSAAVLTTTSTHLHHHTTSIPAQSYSHDNRNFLNNKGVTMESQKIQDSTPLSILSASSIGLKQDPLSVSVLPQLESRLVCSESLLNPLLKNKNDGQKSQNSLLQFMEDRTQLSISIPMGSASSSDLMSSTSSPINERPNLSPLRMGLSVGNTTHTHTNMVKERSSWLPVSWETSMGGPLGEVLHHSTNNSPSALNLMTDGWESGQHMALSPTGVLQKTTFGSLSNSSAGSSPRTDNHLLGSTLIASPLPLL